MQLNTRPDHILSVGRLQGISRLFAMIMVLASALIGCASVAAADPIPGYETEAHKAEPKIPFLLGPPKGAGPVVVWARFKLHDINEVHDGTETFEFSGVLTLKWHDPRQAFDPAVEGVDEKIFQGNYQFNEISTGWYPQVVLVNESGFYQKSGVLLRVQPDGTSTLIETINAAAESEMNMTLFPFDAHSLEAVFEVLGFDKNEVLLQVKPDAAGSMASEVSIPQWIVTGVETSVRDLPALYGGAPRVSSAFVLNADVKRKPFYIMRLVALPLIFIVFLSFSVFWMDRQLLGDRLNISFIGILTGVAYLIVSSDVLPHISYVTLLHGFLNLSFLTMCATVVINIIVGELDKRGKYEIGDRIDHRCRRIFPLVYFGLLLVMLGVAFLFF